MSARTDLELAAEVPAADVRGIIFMRNHQPAWSIAAYFELRQVVVEAVIRAYDVGDLAVPDHEAVLEDQLRRQAG